MAKHKPVLAALLIIVTVFDGASSQAPPQPWNVPWIGTSFNTDGLDRYPYFMDEQLEEVARNAITGVVEDPLTVLLEQRTGRQWGTWEKPDLWNMLGLYGVAQDQDVDDGDNAMLSIRMDNYYIVGFANKWGQWHSLKEAENLIEGAIPLGISTSYTDLAGEFGIGGVRLGREATRWARTVLANFDASSSDRRELRTALTILTLTICEAGRFPSIRESITAGWHSGHFLNRREQTLIWNWRNFSCAILAYERTGRWWDAPEAGILRRVLEIYSVEQARREVALVLQPRTCQETIDVYHKY
ncbi:hypothetical protein ACP4OV_020956 [Aristida adscensionis]